MIKRTEKHWRRPIGRCQSVLLAVALSLLAAAMAAADPPHWAGVNVSIDCTSQCHVLHNSAGVGLTQAASNVTLCQSCHNPSGPYAQDLPVTDSDKANRANRTGISHGFDALAIQDFDGDGTNDVVLPGDTQMQLRVMDGNIVCSTCHNQHNSGSALGGSPRIGPAKQITSLGSTGTATSGGTYTGTAGFWYLIEIVVGGDQTQARFAVSKDNGFTWQDNGVNPCTPTDTTNCFQLDQGAVDLGDGVAVSFSSGNYVDSDPGERWQFSAAFPYLRSTLAPTSGGRDFCLQCHAAWDMTWDPDDGTRPDVETWTGTAKSHPIGVALNANGQGYDRSNPLDGNGSTTPSDGNPSNDLRRFGVSNDQVECLTCHGVHNVDSNTLTDDTR